MEGPDAPLYHGTTARRSVQVIKSGVLESRTVHRIGDRQVPGVSTSRSLGYARHWAQVECGTGVPVVLRLNQGALAHSHRIIPHDLYGGDDSMFPELARYEAGEFIVGTISPLSRYLTGIIIDTAARARLHKARSSLLSHPLLIVQDSSPFLKREV